VEYKTDVTPQANEKGTQAIINDQIGDDYDLYLGILWKRFGESQPTNGLTPTQEEFERAMNRFNKTGKPALLFYFKHVKKSPVGKKRLEQFELLKEFRDKIKSSVYYGDFVTRDDFFKKLLVDINFHIERMCPVALIKPPDSKIKYSVFPDYLSRKLGPTKEGDYFSALMRNEISEELIDILEKHNRIALLSDAGVGKTTELKRAAGYYSANQTSLVPFLIQLNEYVNENLQDLLEPCWVSIPESQLLILLDGLDEIQSKNRNDAIRKIESFCRQYPKSKIVVSCRTNFYKTGQGNEPETLNGFVAYKLLDLTDKDIEKYVKAQLCKQSLLDGQYR
jgi:hypothetical protein